MPDQLGLVCEWYARLSEPVRVRSRFPAYLGHYHRESFGTFIVSLTRDWYQPLSEPVRSKAPLGASRIPYHFAFINIVGYSFSVTETRDSASLTVNVYPPKHWAKVTVTEQSVLTAQVTVQEISYKRKYF